MNDFILITYFISLLILFAFGSHGFVMVFHYFKHRDTNDDDSLSLTEFPKVTVQLPVYN